MYIHTHIGCFEGKKYVLRGKKRPKNFHIWGCSAHELRCLVIRGRCIHVGTCVCLSRSQSVCLSVRVCVCVCVCVYYMHPCMHIQIRYTYQPIRAAAL